MGNILGISLGTRLVGLAVFYDGELSDCRMRTLSGAWSQKKLALMVGYLQIILDRYDIAMIAVKIPPEAHSKGNVLALLHAIQKLATDRNTALAVYTIRDIKRRYNESRKQYNKDKLIAAVTERYSQHGLLQGLALKEKTNRNKYYEKIFEAIACVELAKETGH